MTKKALTLAEKYVGRLQAFERSRTKMEGFFAAKQIGERDLNLFYEGMYLRSITAFEGFVEDLFLGLLTNSVGSANAVPRVPFKSSVVARDVVLGGRPYVEWLPYDATEKRANAFFRGGRPFSNLDNAEKKVLEHMVIIRNVVAHQSYVAHERFEKRILASLSLLAKERTPTGFLRSIFRTNPPTTRYQDIAANTALIARKLCS